MGQALKKLGRGRASSRLPPHTTQQQQPAESRFHDPRLKGHLPGDIHPESPYPYAASQDEDMEWDRSSSTYSKMVKELAGSVVARQVEEGVEHAYSRRPLPKMRNTTDTGFEENSSVPAGKLNVGQIRQIFLSYQGLIKGEKQMSATALAKKYNVDEVLLERVLRLHAIKDDKVDAQHGRQEL